MISRCLAIGLFFSVSTGLLSAGEAQRADAIGVDGIYAGKIGMQLDTEKGKVYDAPAKFVLMPDGKSALLTAQHPGGVLTVILKGSLNGHVFDATSKGRSDYGGFHYGMNWDIRMDPKAGTAVLHGKAVGMPKWAKEDDFLYTFKKQKDAGNKDASNSKRKR